MSGVERVASKAAWRGVPSLLSSTASAGNLPILGALRLKAAARAAVE